MIGATSPPNGPEGVEQARKAVLELHSRVAGAREAIGTAKAQLVEAEQRDRQAMAEQLRAGREAVSDTRSVERAQSAVSAAERQEQALRLAIADSESALHEAVLAARSEWSRSAQRTVVKARERGRKALAALNESLEELRAAQSVEDWLTPDSGLDQSQRARTRGLGVAVESARTTANHDP